jgi:hypothetical protein
MVEDVGWADSWASAGAAERGDVDVLLLVVVVVVVFGAVRFVGGAAVDNGTERFLGDGKYVGGAAGGAAMLLVAAVAEAA